jgi:hypothetical protein
VEEVAQEGLEGVAARLSVADGRDLGEPRPQRLYLLVLRSFSWKLIEAAG